MGRAAPTRGPPRIRSGGAGAHPGRTGRLTRWRSRERPGNGRKGERRGRTRRARG
uniref:Uncharacterized protein n=1 Tax=Arundo donax TaxID=35708 RepID=A0A0A9S096_ARUDO